MSIADTLKGLIFKKPANSAEPRDPRRSKEPLAGGRRAGEAENPYLAARRTWNDHVGSVVSQRQTWQVIGILSLLIAPQRNCNSGRFSRNSSIRISGRAGFSSQTQSSRN